MRFMDCCAPSLVTHKHTHHGQHITPLIFIKNCFSTRTHATRFLHFQSYQFCHNPQDNFSELSCLPYSFQRLRAWRRAVVRRSLRESPRGGLAGWPPVCQLRWAAKMNFRPGSTNTKCPACGSVKRCSITIEVVMRMQGK